MARLHAQFSEMHPELATRFTQQQLRDYVAYLRRTGFQVTPVPPAELEHQPPIERRQTHAGLGAPNRDSTPMRRNLKTKALPKSSDVDRANNHLVDVLPEDCDLWQVNCAVYEAAAALVGPRTSNGISSRGNQVSGRMSRLERKIRSTRQLASRIQCVLGYIENGRKFTVKVRAFAHQLRASHHTLNKLKLLTIKQKLADKIRILADAKRRLKRREKCVWQNAMFLSDPSRLFQEQQPAIREAPSVEKVEEFWRDIYEKIPIINVDTPAIKLFAEFCNNNAQASEECPPISELEVKNAITGTKNFSAPGWDGINNYWWKKFTSTHHHLARIFTSYIKKEQPIPHWFAEGRTVLLPKKGDLSDPKNYRPITCLNTVYKLFTTVLNNRVTKTVDPVWRQIVEQRGCKSGVSGCKENLLIDRCVCQDSIQYKRNLSMAWLDYKKAFDSTSHELICLLLRCLQIHPNIVGCIEELMTLWKTRFTIRAGRREIRTNWIKFQRGVFQGDSMSPLLFCISLLPLSVALRASRGYMCGPPSNRVHKVTHLLYLDDLKLFANSEDQLQRSLNITGTYTRDVGMDFGLDKCAVVHLHRGRSVDINTDAQLVDGSVIRHLGAEETYTYLGVPQRHLQDAQLLKTSLRNRYRRLLREIWSSELSGKNKVTATNILAIPQVLYSFGVLKWNVDELRELDRGTRKMMNMHRSLHPRSSVERLYIPRTMGGRGLLSLECLHNRVVLDTACEIFNRTEDPLLHLVHTHELEGKGAFLYHAAERAARDLGLVFDISRDEPDSITNMEASRLKAHIKMTESNMLIRKHVDKPLHGQFFRNVQQKDLSTQLTFSFLKSSGLKSETEGFIFACQDGVINTLAYRLNVMRQNIVNITCRACKGHAETLMHLLSACPKYAVSAYIHRHNAALRVLYFHLRSTYRIDETPVLPYVPNDIESVVGNELCQIYWNYSFATSRRISANKPDIVLIDLKEKSIYVIEFSAPSETNVEVKEDEKRTKYRELLFEFRRMYRGYAVKLVVLIIGVLGGMKPTFLSSIESIPACKQQAINIVGRMQQAVLLGSLHLLRSHDLAML